MSSGSSVEVNNLRLCDDPKFADALWTYIKCKPLTSEHVLQLSIKDAIMHIINGCNLGDKACGYTEESVFAYSPCKIQDSIEHVRSKLAIIFNVPQFIADDAICRCTYMPNNINHIRSFVDDAHNYLHSRALLLPKQKNPCANVRGNHLNPARAGCISSRLITTMSSDSSSTSSETNNPRLCDDSKFADALCTYLGCGSITQKHVLDMTIKEAIAHLSGECCDALDKCFLLVPNAIYVPNEHNLEYVRTRLARAFDVPKSVADEQILADERFASRRNSLGSFVDASARYHAQIERMNRAEEQMSKSVGPEYVSGCGARLCDNPKLADALWAYLGCAPLTSKHVLQAGIKDAIAHIVYGCDLGDLLCGRMISAIALCDKQNLEYLRTELALALCVPKSIADEHLEDSYSMCGRINSLSSFLSAACLYKESTPRTEEQLSKAVGSEYVSARLCDNPKFTDILWRYLRCEPPTQEHLLNMNIKTAIDHLVFGCSRTSDWCSMTVARGNVRNLEDIDLVFFRSVLAHAFQVPLSMVDEHVKFSGDLDTGLRNLQALLCATSRHSLSQRRNVLFELSDSKVPSSTKTEIPVAPPASTAKIPIRIWPRGDNVKLDSFDQMMSDVGVSNVEENDQSLTGLATEITKLFKNGGIGFLAKQGYNLLEELRKEAELNAAEAPVTLNNFVRQIGVALGSLPKPPREATFTVTLKM